jgi:hypothetical protein
MNQFTPVLFDTSIWGKLIKENISYKEREACGVVPFLPLEVLLELVDIDESNRLKRLTYLSRLPQIATLPLHSEPELGSIPYLILIWKRVREKMQFLQIQCYLIRD